MHIGLSKLIGINDENAPLASRLTEAQFRVWGFRWILPCTGLVSTSPIKSINLGYNPFTGAGHIEYRR